MDGDGFCPVDYFVPDETRVGDLAGRFGFIYGCHWACPYQVQFLDLTKVEEGIVARSDLLIGCVDLPNVADIRLADQIEIRRNNAGGLSFRLRCDLAFHLKVGDGSVVPNAF
jgi:hypothetical protein